MHWDDASTSLTRSDGTVTENLTKIAQYAIAPPFYVDINWTLTPNTVGEMKTKPTQHSVRTLNASGIQPDIIIARAETSLDVQRKNKLSIFCNVNPEDIISAPDVDNIYQVPVNFEKDKNIKINETGTAIHGISVARKFMRNTKRMIETRSTVKRKSSESWLKSWRTTLARSWPTTL